MTDGNEIILYRMQRLEAELVDAEKRLEVIEQGIVTRERNQLITGIIFLGGLVSTLFGVIWLYRKIIFQGD